MHGIGLSGHTPEFPGHLFLLLGPSYPQEFTFWLRDGRGLRHYPSHLLLHPLGPPCLHFCPSSCGQGLHHPAPPSLSEHLTWVEVLRPSLLATLFQVCVGKWRGRGTRAAQISTPPRCNKLLRFHLLYCYWVSPQGTQLLSSLLPRRVHYEWGGRLLLLRLFRHLPPGHELEPPGLLCPLSEVLELHLVIRPSLHPLSLQGFCSLKCCHSCAPSQSAVSITAHKAVRNIQPAAPWLPGHLVSPGSLLPPAGPSLLCQVHS